MAVSAPRRQKVIGINVPGANIGEYVKVTNITSGGHVYAKLQGTDRSAIISQNEDFTWEEGDVIHAEMLGRIVGFTRTTIQGGGADITLSAAADTLTPGADL